jgi:mannose-6-phosphate isomerase-like protein (cupin superfamily)
MERRFAMYYTETVPPICVLTREDYFRPGEHVHIQLSNEYPDYIGVLHKHEFIEMVYIVSGSANHRIGDEVYPVKRGDLFIINMDTAHAFYCDTPSPEPFVAYDLLFTPEFFDQSLTGSNAHGSSSEALADGIHIAAEHRFPLVAGDLLAVLDHGHGQRAQRRCGFNEFLQIHGTTSSTV